MDNRTSVCAGYFHGDLLFDVGGLAGEINPVPDYVALTFAMLTRGIPTQPARDLTERLGFDWSELKSETFYSVARDFPDWSSTIKGGSYSQNPALKFFETLLPEALGEWAFICKLLIPEYPLFTRLDEKQSKKSGVNEELVDFYLPQANLVIEIDGKQHQKTKHKDDNRDGFLSQFGILTVRIATKDLKKGNERFKNAIDQIASRCAASPFLAPYQDVNQDKETGSGAPCNQLTAIIRLQISLIFAIAHKQLRLTDKKWALDIQADCAINPANNWVEAALDELLDWFELFARLKGAMFSRPEVAFCSDGLSIDISLYRCADDRTAKARGITVRSAAVQFLPTKEGAPKRLLGISHIPQIISEVPSLLPDQSDLTELNRRLFGHDSFLPGQRTLIENALSGENSVGLMPTGGGKSLCFELKAMLDSGTTIVVVPIKALGRDHEAELEAAGFSGRAVNIDSDTPAFKRKVFMDRILNKQLRFAFVSPERFQSDEFREVLSSLSDRNGLQMFVVDEVHCMSEWGHDFRPAYLMLPAAMKVLAPGIPIMGLTATASVNVLRDIQSEFNIPDELVAYEMHRSRVELHFSIIKKPGNPFETVKEVIDYIDRSGGESAPPIHIFCRYVNGNSGVEKIATELFKNKGYNLRIGTFSGKVPGTEFQKFSLDHAIERLRQDNPKAIRNFEQYKQFVQSLWKQGALDVIVTTKAFGMGVNKKDVRRTLHAGMPSSMESFYQEAGRAGRDRKDANCDMLFSPEPDDVQNLFISLEKDHSPENMKTAIDSVARSARGDFRSQIWFLNQSNIDILEEAAFVKKLHQYIEAAECDIVEVNFNRLNVDQSLQKHFQHALFRLYQMDIIGPWTVIDWGRRSAENTDVQTIRVQFKKPSFTEACASVAKRMQAISGAGSNPEHLKEVEAIKAKADEWDQLYVILLKWVRNTQFLGRLRSTWNLYEQCNDFTSSTEEEFRAQLESYFKVDSDAFDLASLRDLKIPEATTILESLILMPDGNTLKEDAVLSRLLAQLSRLLEGTRESPGLNLADGILRSLTTNSDNVIAQRSIRLALPDGLLGFWKTDGRNLIAEISRNNTHAREALGRWLVDEKPNRDELLEYHNSTKSEVVGLELFDQISDELEELL